MITPQGHLGRNSVVPMRSSHPSLPSAWLATPACLTPTCSVPDRIAVRPQVGETIALWREEFPRGQAPDEYSRKSKAYEYSVRHMYGLEGQRKAYRSQSCDGIAQSGFGWGGGGLAHGCPFAVAHAALDPGGKANAPRAPTSLRGMLYETPSVGVGDIEDIIGLAGHPRSAQSACARYFSAAHRRIEGDEGANLPWSVSSEATPIRWFAASARLHYRQSFTQQVERHSNVEAQEATGLLRQL